MKQIVIIKPKALTPKDKERLSKAGYVVIEHNDPSEVRIVTQINEVDSNMLLMSAMRGATDGYSSKEKFANELYKRMLEAESKNKTNP